MNEVNISDKLTIPISISISIPEYIRSSKNPLLLGI